MWRFVGALSSLTVMVTLWAAFADDLRADEADHPFLTPPVQLNLEQQEVVSEVLDELGRTVLQAIQPFVKAENWGVDENAADQLIHEEDFGEFRAILKPELRFLRKVCDLSEPEYQAMSQSCDAALREVVQQFVAEQGQQERDVNIGRDPGIEPKPIPQRIREAVSQIAECQLTPQQWSRYSNEVQLRSVRQKRVAILNLVARLDQDLRLSSMQREQFVKLLDENWKDSWGQSLGAFADGSNFMPALAEDDVRPILSPAQYAVLSELAYDDEPDIWGDGSVELFFDMDDAVMVDDETPADSNMPQTPNAIESDH